MLGAVKALWAKSWPVKASGRNPICFDEARSQVSSTVRDSPCLETRPHHSVALGSESGNLSSHPYTG